MLRHALEAQGHTVVEARDQPEAVAALQQRAARRRAVRSAPDRRRRLRRAARGEGARSRAAGDRDDGVRQHPGRGRGDEGRRARFPRQAGRSRSPAADGRARARAAPARDREHAAQGGARAAARRAADRRRGSEAEAGVASRCTARRRPTRPCCSRARAAPARSCSRARCTRSARAPTVRSSPSTAPRFPRTCSRPSCSATRRARSPARSRASRASSSWRIAARCSSTRSATCRCRCRPKILRALEEKRFERVGGTAPLQVDVRVVAATNRNLKAAVAARQYREDLYFRLSVFPITIPPLRERPDDIPMLARYFIDRFCRDLNKKPLMLAPSADRGAARVSLARQRARAAELHRARGDSHRRRHDSRAASEPVVSRRCRRPRQSTRARARGTDRSVGHAGRCDEARASRKSSGGRSSRR